MIEEIKEELAQVRTEMEALLNKQKSSIYEKFIQFVALPLCLYLLVSTYQNVQDIKEKVLVSIQRIDQIEQRQTNVERKVYGFGSLEATKKELITLSSLINP